MTHNTQNPSTTRSIPRQKRIQRIQLEAYDDVISVKDRLQFVKAGRVLLVFPDKHPILQRKLDLVLIQREAARRDLRLAIVTHDPTVADHAEELNISAFYTVEQARTQRWKRPRNKVFIDRADRPYEETPYWDLMHRASRLHPTLTPAQARRLGIMRGLVFGVAILAILFGLYVVVPSATVTLTPAKDQLNVTVPLVADPSATRFDDLTVPAEIRRFLENAEVTISTTGLRNAENSLARGVVTFENVTGLATFIPAGTIVETEGFDPIQFETLEDVALPASRGSARDARVQALPNSSGVQGNLPSNSLVEVRGALAESVTVRNFNPTYGGGIREEAFATQGDRDRLLTLARQKLIQNARNALLLNLDEATRFLVEETIHIVEERNLTYSAEVNEPAETITLTMQGVVEAIVINLTEARLAAFTTLPDYVPSGRLLNEASFSFRMVDEVQVLPDNRVAFQMRIEGSTQVAISADEVSQKISGNSKKDALAILERDYLLDPRYPPQISTFPGFLNHLPWLSARITVVIDEEG